MSFKNKQQGFTIVELLIVIVVIGILAALVITTFTGIQKKARDTERTTDIKALHSALEAYYASAGNYPTFAQFDDPSWRTTNMKGLDNEAFKDPRGANSSLAATPGTNVYAYAVLNSSGASCAADPLTCATYTLTATNEGTPPTYEKKSLN